MYCLTLTHTAAKSTKASINIITSIFYFSCLFTKSLNRLMVARKLWLIMVTDI
jgi:hypothetical protein